MKIYIIILNILIYLKLSWMCICIINYLYKLYNYCKNVYDEIYLNRFVFLYWFILLIYVYVGEVV